MAFPGQAAVRWIMVRGKRIPIFAKKVAQNALPVAADLGVKKAQIEDIIEHVQAHPNKAAGFGHGLYSTAKGIAGWTAASNIADKIRSELEPGYIQKWWMHEMSEPVISIGKNKSVKLQKVDPKNPFRRTSQPYRDPKLPPLPTAGQNDKDANYNQGYNSYKAPVKDSTVYKPKNELTEQEIKLKKGKIVKLVRQKAGPFIPSIADPADTTEAFDDDVISFKNLRNILEDVMGSGLNRFQISKLMEEILNVTREYSADEIDEMSDADLRKLIAQFDFENLAVKASEDEGYQFSFVQESAGKIIKWISVRGRRIPIMAKSIGEKLKGIHAPVKTPLGMEFGLFRKSAEGRQAQIDLLKSIREGVIQDKVVGQGINAPKRVQFVNGAKAIFKPLNRYDISGRNECIFGNLADELGIGQYVPATVRVKSGVFQHFIDGAKAVNHVALDRNPFEFKRNLAKIKKFIESEDGRKMGILDYLVGQSDRHNGNIMFNKEKGVCYLIDNEAMFNEIGKELVTSPFTKNLKGVTLTDNEIKLVSDIKEKARSIIDSTNFKSSYDKTEAINTVVSRIEYIEKNHKINSDVLRPALNPGEMFPGLAWMGQMDFASIVRPNVLVRHAPELQVLGAGAVGLGIGHEVMIEKIKKKMSKKEPLTDFEKKLAMRAGLM